MRLRTHHYLLSWAILAPLYLATYAHPQQSIPGTFAPPPPVTSGSGPVSSTPYNCPSSCSLPNCVCASKDPPGGLSKDQTPQFVTLTFDDAITSLQWDPVSEWLNSTKNPNGCYLPAVFYVSTAWTEFSLVTRAYNLGHEIGVHTINHYDSLNISLTNFAAEINGATAAISAFGGVPKSKITGFRHPFLSFSKGTYDEVFKAGFQYETSITLLPTTQGYWPHTLDYGMPYDPQPCRNCPPGPSFVYPGKWIIPMWNLVDNTSAVWTSMDPIIIPQYPDTYEKALANLQTSFRLHYQSKLPFGLYQHAAQLIAWGPEVQVKKVQLLKDFVQWTLTSPEFKDVWYVTNQQLLQWMSKPVPADKMLEFLPCNLPAQRQSGNPEICDGLDNDGDGVVDNGVVDTCSFPEYSFSSCFGCPRSIPNFTNPVPERTSGQAKVFIPDQGCPNPVDSWDPVKGSCVSLTRPRPELPLNSNTNKGGAPGNNRGSGAFTVAVPTFGIYVLAAFMALRFF